MKIAVAGTGYVGMSIATLLAQKNHVTAVDVIPEKVEKINKKISPIQDEYIEKYLAEKELDLTATLDGKTAYKDADFVVIAAPTNYDPQKNFFDTHHIEDVIVCFSHRSSCVRVRRYMTIFIPLVSSWAIPRSCLLTETGSGMRRMLLSRLLVILRQRRRPRRLLVCYRKVLSKRILIRCLWV